MDLPLIYPTKELSSVKIGILSVAVMRIMSDNNLRLTGEMPFHILSSACVSTKPEQFYDVSSVDASRIIFAAWRQSHGSDQWLAKVACDCGQTALIQHDVNVEYKKPDIYDKEHIVKAVDGKTFEMRDFKLVLRPGSLKSSIDGAMVSMDDTDSSDKLVSVALAHIKSIDGNENLDANTIPLSLFKASAALVKEDVSNTDDIAYISQKCVKCKEDVTSVIGWHDATFLQG